MDTSTRQPRPLALIIMDGWGYRAEQKDNGIALAHKPFFDHLWQQYPHTFIDGSGPAVGLPQGVMGNSEVGHMNLGAGRVVYTGLSQMYKAIEDGSFFTNPQFLKAVQQVKKNNSTLHLFGLLSDGAVHSHQDHLYALLKLAKQNQVQDVAIHCFMDGRDTPPNNGIKYIQQLEDQIKKIGIGRIVSISGRYWAMDRDQRWDRVAKAFVAMCGTSTNVTTDYKKYIQDSYAKGVSDEFIEPVSVLSSNGQLTSVSAHDAMIFFNFRADRAREITRAFVDKDFPSFDRQNQALPAVYVCAAPYDVTIKAPVAFEPKYPQQILSAVLAEHHLMQLRIAETEKYAHVTFFFNGGQDIVFDGEERMLIPSPKEVATYDLKPEMSAYLVKDKLIECVRSKKHDVIICNFANADMVGHTAVPAAIIKAIEVVDQCLSEVIPAILSAGGTVLLTADHGNAELMKDENGEPMTAHTTNLVPFVFIGPGHESIHLRSGGKLCDVAPTMLKLLNILQPREMTGESLI